ncbi:Acetyl-CoA carboxylase carboxyl transferase, beta subunit like protein, partial [Aduncisulcus paluster]
ANPLGYEGFDLKLDEARKKTGLRSSCITFETRMDGINAVVICLAAPFRGGSVGAAEGEKIIRAAERAQRKQLPLIFYAHGTAGIRIQEGTNGVLQMPRCTMALRKVITETTGIPVPPNYHNAWNALARGHIQGIWDRREMGRNIGQALMTMGGRNLYYR